MPEDHPTPSSRPKLFRRQFVVFGPGQYLYGTMLALLVLTVLGGMLAAFLVAYFTASQIPCPDQLGDCRALLFDPSGVVRLSMLTILMMIPATLLAFALGVVLSHRTFGPMVRFRQFLQQLIDGNYAARIQLRPHDHMGELSALLNELAETLQKRHGG